MTASGLEDLLATIYASNSVGHIMSGKAVSRAMRGHSLVETALGCLLMSEDHPDIANLTPESKEDQKEISPAEYMLDILQIYDRIIAETTFQVPENDIDSATQKLMLKMAQKREATKEARTSKLWFQYLDMVAILHQFIRAERTGDWDLHLKSLAAMLPYLAASGHNLYTKSICLYLQKMATLETDHPEVYAHFKRGLHVIRRSARFWAGHSTDLTIEQTLMRTLKSRGGLTRGKGMTEKQRTLWVASRPAYAEIDLQMQSLVGLRKFYNEQHVDASDSRVRRDCEDIKKLLAFLLEKNPFEPQLKSLRSISTGETAHHRVNVESTLKHGQAILEKMHGRTLSDFSFKRSDQSVTMASKNTKIDDAGLQGVQPELLFQRFMIVSRSMENTESAFKYELCSYPPALFETQFMMRKATKSALADAIWKWTTPIGVDQEEGGSICVLDGGSLLHRVSWTQGVKYEDIAKSYSNFVLKAYGQNGDASDVHVIFDGYISGHTTKDQTHLRRNKGQVGVAVNFTPVMMFQSKRELFLSNPENKQRMITLIVMELRKVGCHVVQAEADADLVIVQTALNLAQATAKSVTVIAEDTDILVLLLCHTTGEEIYFRSDIRRVKKEKRVWDIQATKSALGNTICDSILFSHAFLGCDTTSALFGIGKGITLNRKCNDKKLQELSQVFMSPRSEHDAITAAGEAAFILVYGGKEATNLDDFRYERFCQRAASSSTAVRPASLPPTRSAGKYHSLRVYNQVQQWIGTAKDAEEWGWELKDGILKPVMTDQSPAPPEILSMVKCGCKGDCTSTRCTCRKYELECSVACTECKGSACANSQIRIESDAEDDQ